MDEMAASPPPSPSTTLKCRDTNQIVGHTSAAAAAVTSTFRATGLLVAVFTRRIIYASPFFLLFGRDFYFFRRPFPFFFILSNLVFIFGLVNCWFGQKTTRCDSFSFPPGLSWEIVHSLALIDFYLIQFESLNTLSSKSGLQNDFPIGLTQHSRETLSLKKGFR